MAGSDARGAVKPILFNTEMVRAILDGRKTVTRRVVKPQPEMALAYIWGGHKARHWGYSPYDEENFAKYRDSAKYWTPPCNADDILYVRETWSQAEDGVILYRAWPGKGQEPEKQDESMRGLGLKWRPSIHMPREAARIFLRVTNVRVEQLWDMTEEDVRREGLENPGDFIRLWDSTIKPADRDRYGWAANPWVWVIEFERCEKPEVAANG